MPPPSDSLHFRQTEDGAATFEADGLFAFVALASGVPHGAAPERAPQQPAAHCDARDDTLPSSASTFSFSRAEVNFLSLTDSGLPAAETPIAAPRRMMPSSQVMPSAAPSAARKVRSVVHLEDVLEELHVAVRLREEPLPRAPRRQKLQSSMD